MKKIYIMGQGIIYRKCWNLTRKRKDICEGIGNPSYLASIQWPYILPQTMIKNVNGNAFNLHNADTQTYRGCHCIEWEIYNKESEHAVTIHRMTEKPDLGPIAFQEWIPIEKNDTPGSLWQKSVPVAVNLFGRLLDYIIEDKEIPKIELNSRIGKFYKRGEKPDTRQ